MYTDSWLTFFTQKLCKNRLFSYLDKCLERFYSKCRCMKGIRKTIIAFLNMNKTENFILMHFNILA